MPIKVQAPHQYYFYTGIKNRDQSILSLITISANRKKEIVLCGNKRISTEPGARDT